MNLVSITAAVNSLVKQTGVFIATERRQFSLSSVSDKGLNQLVSYVDVEAEKMLVSGLKNIFPEAGFITEENTEGSFSEKQQYNWIIDPLDGTTNFIHNIPVYSISVALCSREKTLCGVVYEINRDELFTAWHGGGSWLNGSPITCSDTTVLKQSLLATGFPYYDFGKMEEYLALLKHLMKATHGLRRLGSAAVDLAYVAAGRFEGFFEYGLNAWDVAAGALLIEEAGGHVGDFNGGSNYIFGKEIVAGNKGIYADFESIVRRHLGESDSQDK